MLNEFAFLISLFAPVNLLNGAVGCSVNLTNAKAATHQIAESYR